MMKPEMHLVRTYILLGEAADILEPWESADSKRLARAHAKLTRAQEELNRLMDDILKRWHDTLKENSPSEHQRNTDEWIRIHKEQS